MSVDYQMVYNFSNTSQGVATLKHGPTCPMHVMSPLMLTVYSPGGGDLYALARHGRSARSLSTSRVVIKQLLFLVLATEQELSGDRSSKCPVEARPKKILARKGRGVTTYYKVTPIYFCLFDADKIKNDNKQ